MAEFSIDRFVDRYAHRTEGMSASEVRALFAVASRPEVVSLAGGMPYVQALPTEDVLEVVRQVLDEHGTMALQYGGGQGHVALRERLVALMSEEAIAADPEDMVITTGAQQALDLVGKIFIDPGDLVAVEAPAYVGALTAFSAYEPRYLQIDLDDEGMIVDQLEEAFVRGDRPKFVYTCPNFGNPAGVTLSYARRQRLVSLCREAGVPIVEDNPYGMLRFEGDALPALRTLDPDNVIYLGTVSKVFSPGVRVGWALAEQSVIQRLVLAKEAADLCGSSFNMLVTERYFAGDRWRTNLATLVDTYRGAARRDARGDRRDVPRRRDVDPPGGRLLRVGDPPGLGRHPGDARGGRRAPGRLRARDGLLPRRPRHEPDAARLLLPDRGPDPRGHRPSRIAPGRRGAALPEPGRMRVAVLAGGRTPERDVSLRSGHRVMTSLIELGHDAWLVDPAEAALVEALREREPELCYLALHGKEGEDGTVQRLLHLLDLPFTGTAPFDCEVAFDKVLAKDALRRAGVDTPAWVTIEDAALRDLGAGAALDQVVERVGLPCVVKPSRSGSALGVSFVERAVDLPAAVMAALSFSGAAIVERTVEGTEVAVGLVGSALETLPAVEIVPKNGVYDYAARYTAGATEYFSPARLNGEVAARGARGSRRSRPRRSDSATSLGSMRSWTPTAGRGSSR